MSIHNWQKASKCQLYMISWCVEFSIDLPDKILFFWSSNTKPEKSRSKLEKDKQDWKTSSYAEFEREFCDSIRSYNPSLFQAGFQAVQWNV